MVLKGGLKGVILAVEPWEHRRCTYVKVRNDDADCRHLIKRKLYTGLRKALNAGYSHTDKLYDSALSIQIRLCLPFWQLCGFSLSKQPSSSSHTIPSVNNS